MNNKDEKPKKNQQTIRALANFSHVGVTIAASVLVGVLLGRFIDRLFSTSPVFLLIFSLLGVGAAIKTLFDMANKKNKD